MLVSTTIDTVDVYLLTAEPDRAAALPTTCNVLVDRDAGLSQREQRRAFGATLRWTLGFTARLDIAEGRALRAALRGYDNEPILCPMWPAATLVSDVAAAPLTGGLMVTFEPDWSSWELHTGSAVGSYSAAALTAPVLYGRFDQLPEPSAESDERGPCAFALVETGPAAYAIAPRSTSTTNGPSLHATTWPLFAEHVQYDTAMPSGGIDLRVQRERIGYGRDETSAYVSQTARSAGTLRFEGDSEAAMRLVALFLAVKGSVSPFWWPGAHAEWRLAADASSGSADITLEEAPVAPYPDFVLLRHANGTLAARQVLSVASTTVTLSSAPGTFARRSTSLLPLYFGRFAGAELALDWREPGAVRAEVKLIELPTETDVPDGETLGTTIGAQAAKWWGYKVTDGNSTWRFTSYESEIDAGMTLGTFTPAPIDHGDIVMELNLKRHDVQLTIGTFEDSPFERLRTDPFAPPLTVQIYEGTIASPSSAAVIFTGKVRAPKFSGSKCTCTLAGLTSIFDVRGPLAVTSPRCWVPLYSSLCGLDRAAQSIDVDLASDAGDGTVEFEESGGGFPVSVADWYRFGYAERTLADGTKQRYRIAGSAAATGGGTGDTIGSEAVIAGSDASTLSGNASTNLNGQPNNCRIWWNAAQSRWDGLVVMDVGSAGSESDYVVVKDLLGTPTATSVVTETRNAARGDVWWDEANGRLHVIGWHGASGSQVTQYYGVDYNSGTDTYSLAVSATTIPGLGLAILDLDNTGGMAVDSAGRIWAAVCTTAGIKINRSTDGGSTWVGSATSLRGAGPVGVVTVLPFTNAGTEYILVFASEDAGGDYRAYTIPAASASISSGNWTNESGSVPGFLGTEGSDNHCCGQVHNNVCYIAVKNQGGASGDPAQTLLVRTAAGSWSRYTVYVIGSDDDDNVPSRPAVAIDATHSRLFWFCQDQDLGGTPPVGRGTDNIFHKSALLSALSSLQGATEYVDFEGSSTYEFRNVSVPRGGAGSEGIAMLCSENVNKTQWACGIATGDGPLPTNATITIALLGAISPTPGAYPETGWTLVPGCDKSFAKCDAFNNTDNFRGFPRFPRTNPALVPLKQESPTGGKK